MSVIIAKMKDDRADRAGARLEWMDRLRSVLTVLVVSVHAAITYGAEGGWYHAEPATSSWEAILMTLHNAVVQSFFMSLFFFLAGHCLPDSLGRKGPRRYASDRLIRLGLPSLAFLFGLGPLTFMLAQRYLDAAPLTYWQSVHIGPLWFTQALLIFTGAVLAYRFVESRFTMVKTPEPEIHRRFLIGLTVLLALFTFLARWAWPMGHGIWGMQLGSFPQYIAAFTMGILIRRQGLIHNLNSARILPLAGVAVLMLILLPFFMAIGAHPELGLEPFMGGLYWQAGVYAVWESVMGMVMCILILAVFQRRNRSHSPFTREFSASAFGIYILHSPVLIGLTIAMASLQAASLIKYALLLFWGTAITLVVVMALRRVPGVRQVL